MNMARLTQRLFLVAFFLLPTVVLADLDIVVTKGYDSKTKMAIVPFFWGEATVLPEKIDAIMTNNMVRTGRFDVLPSESMLSQPSTEVEEAKHAEGHGHEKCGERADHPRARERTSEGTSGQRRDDPERGEERRRPVDHLVIVGVAIDFGELAAQAEPERRVECWIHGDGVLSF